MFSEVCARCGGVSFTRMIYYNIVSKTEIKIKEQCFACGAVVDLHTLVSSGLALFPDPMQAAHQDH